jgi:hypothetical protein
MYIYLCTVNLYCPWIHICELFCSLKSICNFQINTRSIFIVIAGQVQSGENFEQTNMRVPSRGYKKAIGCLLISVVLQTNFLFAGYFSTIIITMMMMMFKMAPRQGIDVLVSVLKGKKVAICLM